MKKTKTRLTHIGALIFFVSIACTSCFTSCGQTKSKNPAANNPSGYDLQNPEKFNMPTSLLEISGITFLAGNADTVYAQQDEEGKIYKVALNDKTFTTTKFAKNADFEDVTILGSQLIVLKSNGSLSTLPLKALTKKKTDTTIETEDILPKGEYESLYADGQTNLVYVLCKDCKQDKNTKKTSGFVLHLQADNTFKVVDTFVIDVTDLPKLDGRKKGTFHPSAMAKNQFTKEWYIVSAINKALLVTDENWSVKNVYHLSSNIFNQPEGIAFDKDNNLYIANEGSDTQYGNILKFSYKKP